MHSPGTDTAAAGRGLGSACDSDLQQNICLELCKFPAPVKISLKRLVVVSRFTFPFFFSSLLLTLASKTYQIRSKSSSTQVSNACAEIHRGNSHQLKEILEEENIPQTYAGSTHLIQLKLQPLRSLWCRSAASVTGLWLRAGKGLPQASLAA